jgi:hypothetical protein
MKGMIMNLEEAKQVLNEATRHELSDKFLGDMEVVWTVDKMPVGSGYFGLIVPHRVAVFHDKTFTDFFGEEANELLLCGSEVIIEEDSK